MNLLMMITFTIICMLYVLLNILVSERFINWKPVIIYKVDIPQTIITVYDNVGSINISELIRELPEVHIIKENKTPNLQINDALQIKNDIVLTSLPDFKILTFISNDISITDLNNKFSLNQDLIIDIFDKSHQSLILLILQCSGINDTLINKIEFNIITQDRKPLFNVLFFYDTPYNINKYLEANIANYTILHYEQCDPNMIFAINPLLYFRNFDMSVLVPSFKDRFPIRRILCIDIFIVIKNISHSYSPILYKLLQYTSNEETYKNNYYRMFFNYSEITLQYLRRYNNHIVNRDNLPILEQFSNNIEYTPKRNIDGFLANSEFILTNNVDNIEGVPINGTNFIFINQHRKDENGIYKGIQNKLIKISEPIIEGDYRCVDINLKNIDEQTKEACEKPVDAFNRPRPFPTFWDKSCSVNTECPFYQSNKLYKNYRGGCNDGYCEMPIGIKRLAFTKYDESTKPVCHNCPEDNIRCCDKQKNKDYAFELDLNERLSQGIK